jgi:hypothetical protein
MKTTRCVLPGILALFMAPLVLLAANSPGKPGTPTPSVHLRQLIDSTMRKINNISEVKQPPLDRTTLMVAQAEYTAKVQTAPPAQQPMYQAALNVVNNLIAAVEEHEKAVATFHYSKNVHGKQDREDAKVSRAASRDDVAKQNMENDASRKALLDKEKFMNNGTLATWQQRIGQLHDAVEQALTVELVDEQKLAMAASATPPPIPAPKTTPRPAESSAAQTYSPVGTWTAPHGQWTLTDDGNFTAPGAKGTWQWSDRTKRELDFKWKSGVSGKGTFSVDGKTLEMALPNGAQATLTR